VVGNATVRGHRHATVWVTDALPTGTLRAVRTPVHVREGHDAVVVVKRTGTPELRATVRYRAYAYRSAYPSDTTGWADGRDFRTVAGTLTFAPGERRARIRVPVLRDRLAEPAEAFYVVLGDASGAALVPPFDARVVIRPE